jgi:hypothetical protein
MYMPLLPQDAVDAAPPLRGPGRSQGDGPAVPPVPVAAPAAPETRSSRPDTADAARPAAAIFVRNRDTKDIEDSHVMALEDYLVAELDGACFTTMSREDVEIAVARFAKEGANAGTGTIDPAKDLDRLLSDNASALSLAQSMGADYVLVASLTDLSIDRRALTDPARGVKSEVESFRLDVTYRILGRAEGRVVASGQAGANDSVRQTPELKVERDVVSDLVRTSAAKLAAAMKKRCEKTALPAPDALVRIPLEIQATTSDFAVPEIVKDDKGQWTISAGRFRLEPSEFLVKIDGRLVGSTPAPIEVVKGLRKIEVSRPDYETYSATINVQPGIGAIKIPMKMTDAGLARVAEMTAFFQGLKQGQQLTDAQVKVLEGYAEFFRNSKFSIDQKTDVKVDTDQAPVFENNSFWSGVPWVR